MSKVLSVRVDDDLGQWVDDYAARRDVKRVVVIEAALREFRAACRGGVPDLMEPRPVGRPPNEGRPARGVRVDSLAQARLWALERQARLNKAKGKAGS